MKKLLAVTAIAMSFSSQAALVNITGGVGPGSTGVMSASNLESLNFTINNATSVYYKNPFVSRVDANKVAEGDLFTDRGVTVVKLPDFSTQTTCDYSSITLPCYGNSWQLEATYDFYGAVVDAGTGLAGTILGGFININYVTNPTNSTSRTSTAATSIAITGSAGPLLTSVGVNLFGSIDYSGFTTVSPLIKNMFNFSSPVSVGGVKSTNWYDLWAAGVAASPQQFVNSFVVTTLNGSNQNLTKIEDINYGTTSSTINFDGSPFQDAIFASYPFAGLNNTSMLTAARSGEILSGNVTFGVVPEPVSIALFGAGLLGMGLVSRRREKKVA
ncbi:MAG: PEP-CTERM sorting domain-containing protein [Paraglaciecola sp.]|nr:PEP-CTERM sorting domain-containing protein [Paraglaciecola sp.]